MRTVPVAIPGLCHNVNGGDDTWVEKRDPNLLETGEGRACIMSKGKKFVIKRRKVVARNPLNARPRYICLCSKAQNKSQRPSSVSRTANPAVFILLKSPPRVNMIRAFRWPANIPSKETIQCMRESRSKITLVNLF